MKDAHTLTSTTSDLPTALLLLDNAHAELLNEDIAQPWMEEHDHARITDLLHKVRNVLQLTTSLRRTPPKP